MHAASEGHVNVVQCLVGAGANLEAAHRVWSCGVGSMLMCDMVIDPGSMHSIDASCLGG
jgi:hypothetical protein